MPLQIPQPTSPLHLYRHLLRESTYLPALCRPWIASRIRQRFRDRRRENPSTPFLKQAHSSLRYLRSVNAGHADRLTHLCLMAAGRIGKRRRILAVSQLSHRPPTDDAELEQERVKTVRQSPASDSDPARDAAAAPSRKHDWLDNWSLDMILALARSQLNQQNGTWPVVVRRSLDTTHIFKGTNCFGRPHRPSLVRKRLKKHWAAVLKQLQPPLPQGEWDHLASLVRGEAVADELTTPSRRPVAQSARNDEPTSTSEPWDWSQYVLKPARVIERGSSRRFKALTGEEDQDPRGPGRPIGVRVTSPRRLRRIYGRVWNMSPIIKETHQNKKTGQKHWSVTWGEHEQRISPPSTSDLTFFRGVSNDGRVLPTANAPSKGAA